MFKKKTKGSAYGWKFLFFSACFYGFLFFILSMDNAAATKWLATSSNVTFSTAGNSSTDYGDLTNMVNPFSGIGFLVWLGIAIGLVDAFIIFSSFQVLGTGGS